MAKFIIFVSIGLLCVYLTEQTHFLSVDHIKKINNAAKTWKARQNFHPDTPMEFITGLLGVKSGFLSGPVKKNDNLYVSDKEVPDSFDARTHWKKCKTIGNIPNQGNCGSCWAFGSTSAFSDRLCIATNGTFNQLLSVQEMLSCCRSCGFGCHGGYPFKAWKYLSKYGVVTGGGYNTFEGCQPYKIKPCIQDKEGKSSCANEKLERSGRCSRKCYGNKTIDYKSDHSKTKDAYFLKDINIQKDLLAYGPIEAAFTVYDDFPHYSSGVYEKTPDAKSLGGHAVKLIGWGFENGVPYWLLVNSWGREWGDKGTFKIIRGTNECEIEDDMTAGVPLV